MSNSNADKYKKNTKVEAVTPPKTKAEQDKPPKKPPKKPTVPPPDRPTRSRTGRPPELERQLQEFFLNIGLIVTPFNMTDAQIIAANSEQLARSWAELAKKNASVKKALERMMEGSAWSGVIFSTGVVAFAIAQNHNLMPEFTFPLPGVEQPEEPENA